MSESKRRKLPPWMQGRSQEQNAKNHQSGKASASVLNLPDLKFPGSVIYSYNKDDCCLICEEIRSSLDEKSDDILVVGFDMEWPVTYEVGKEPKTALIQLCTSENKCYLFHVSCMPEIPKPLRNILLDHRMKKAGVGIESDFWKLDRDFDISATTLIKNSMINLTHLANQVLSTKENWSLNNLCRHLLKKTLDKSESVRKSDWRNYPLSEAQIQYAALDAYASLLLYKELTRRNLSSQS